MLDFQQLTLVYLLDHSRKGPLQNHRDHSMGEGIAPTIPPSQRQ